MWNAMRGALVVTACAGVLIGCGDDDDDAGVQAGTGGGNAAGRGGTSGGNSDAGPAGEGGAGDGGSIDAGGDDACFSPTQNLDTAYDDGARGCRCNDGDGDLCIDGVALVCDGARWGAVEDGPCEPRATCEGGEIVDSSDECLVDDAFCHALDDGRYCTGPQAPMCPAGSTPIASDAECPDGSECFQYSESLRCQRPDETTGCGARLGDTCSDDEYCAYAPGQLCGAADASAICQPRPTSCDDVYEPVCGCDGTTYPNACEANAAGIGLLEDVPCD